MNEISKILLNIVSAELFNADIDIPDTLDWDELFSEASAQSVFLIVYKQIEKKLPADQFEKWDTQVQKFLVANVQINFDNVELHEFMTAAGIPYVTMKGLASASHYKNPGTRIMGDVDFLVREQDMEAASCIVKQAGFREKHRDSKHIEYEREGSIWEQHKKVSGLPDGKNGKLLKKYFADIWDTAEEYASQYGSIRIPDRFHHGLILLIHTASHLTEEGIGLRHLCDWAVFYASLSDDEFRATYEEKLKAVGLWHFAQVLSRCCATYLKSPDRQWTGKSESQLEKQLMEDILTGGNFGRKVADRQQQKKYIKTRGTGRVESKNVISQVARNINKKSKRKYKFIKKYPILLPLGWVLTLSQYVGMVLTGKRKLDNKTTLSAAAIRKNIYKELKLYEE